MKNLDILFLCAILWNLQNVVGQCVVTLHDDYGEVDGYGLLQTTPKGYSYCSFLSIPYAHPPIGALRFEPPQSLELSLYSHLWDFSNESPMCIQNSLFTNAAYGQEDCLYLNVYTKNTFWVELRPVIVWIHGGFFNYGSAHDDGANNPEYLVDEDIVVVTFNYRLGVLGFFYRDGEDIVGNNGLRDQIEVLHWVRMNIETFGGDPERVTLMGIDSGSASIAYHLQAPQSMGYFHGAIMQSGSSLNPWAYQRNPEKCIKSLCRSLQIPCYRGQLKEILQSLEESSFSHKDFNEATSLSYFGHSLPCFGPTMDIIETPPGAAMVQDKQQRLLLQPILSDVPLMIGYTVGEMWDHVAVNRDSLARPWNYTFPNGFKSITQPLRQFFIDNTKELNNYTKQLLVRSLIENGVKDFAKFYASEAISSTYLYRFSYKNTSNDIGPLHGEDIGYIFKNYNDYYTEESYKDGKLGDKMIQYISNFAKYGNPTPRVNNDNAITEDWLPYGNSRLRMEISDESKMVRDVNDESYRQWEAILQCLDYNLCHKFFKLTSDW